MVTTSLLNSSIDGGTIHLTNNTIAIRSGSNIMGMSSNKSCTLGISHGEDTSHDRNDSSLVDFIPILSDLLCHILHEVNTTSNVVGEVLFSPCLCTTNNNTAMRERLSGLGRNISNTIVVQRNGTTNQTL